MTIASCRCSYVPPHVLDSLARADDGDTRRRARLTVQESVRKRKVRSERVVEVAALAATRTRAATKIQVFDSENKWQTRVTPLSPPFSGKPAAKEIHGFTQDVVDYLDKDLKRNSIDNHGMAVILNVHYGVDYMNAFWDGDEMVFGDGDGQVFVSFTKSPEVAAHELFHGITQFTAGLVYQSQSGALNEHFSDVFGTVVTQRARKQKANSADWLIGDEIMGPSLYGEALRSMRAPGTAYDNKLMGKDPQPDHMSNYYAGPEDNQGVHINSGIPNKAFYLVATTIGTDKAALIWYEALQNLWASAKFNDAVLVLVESARSLTKRKIVPSGSTQTVRSAFREVGLST